MIAALELNCDPQNQILVVDGSRGTRRILTLMLERTLTSARVESAGSAAEALALAATTRFSLITTALLLPDMDGLQFAEQARNLIGYSETPVVIVSGDAKRHAGPRYHGYKFSGFFDKSEGYRRLIDYLRCWSPSQKHSPGRILYASQRADQSRRIAKHSECQAAATF